MSLKPFLVRSCFVLAAASLFVAPATAQVLPYPSVELTLSGGEDLGSGGILMGAGDTLTIDIDVRGQGLLHIGFSSSQNWNTIDPRTLMFWTVPVADENVHYELALPKALAGLGFTVQAVLQTDEGFFASAGASILIVDPDRRNDAVDPRDYGFVDAPADVARPARRAPVRARRGA